jgi:2-oxoisovalerate dehydrogenase E1 component alpha subunit
VTHLHDASPARAAEALPFVQLLTADGDRVEHPGYRSVLDADQLRGLYRDLMLVRRLDVEATALQRQGELGLWASLLGQEAAQVGSARAMAAQDYAFPTYREHGVAWCRGVDPVGLLGLFRGVNQGGWDPTEHNFHLYSIVIATHTLHATGYAMGIQRDGAVGTGDPTRDAAVIAYFGDGATAEGDVNEAFVFAAVTNAPVVFFCQNNQFAISEPNERQTRTAIYQRAAGFGFPGVQVDGNDVIAVHAVTTAALDRAHRGDGPTLIEAFTYRMGAHTTSDDPTRYRRAGELQEWQAKDPIRRLRTYLERSGQADAGFFAGVDADADAFAVRLRQGCLATPEPEPGSMFDHAYHEPHAQLDEDRAWFATYQSSFTATPEVAR